MSNIAILRGTDLQIDATFTPDAIERMNAYIDFLKDEKIFRTVIERFRGKIVQHHFCFICIILLRA